MSSGWTSGCKLPPSSRTHASGQIAAALTCDSGIPEGSTAVMQRGWGGRGVTSATSSPDDAFHVNSSLLHTSKAVERLARKAYIRDPVQSLVTGRTCTRP